MTDDLLQWIRRGLEQPDRTQRGLAKVLGLDPSAVSRLMNGQRRLRAEELRLVAHYLGIGPPAFDAESATSTGSSSANDGQAGPTPAGFSPTSLPRDVPVYGVAVGGNDGAFLLNGEILDYVRRPPGVAGTASVFAVYVMGDSMSPRYDAGDLVFLHPHRPPTAGCDVVVELIGAGEGEPGPCFIKRLLRLSAKSVQLAQFNPPRDDIEYLRDEVRHVYRVLSNAELLGI